MKKLVVVVLLLTAHMLPALAVDRLVGGTDPGGGSWWTGSWTNLQTAIQAAGSGDVVKVSGDLLRNSSDGSGVLTVSNSCITISGGWNSNFTTQAWRNASGLAAESSLYSVLDANADSAHESGCISVQTNGVSVEGFTLKGGYSSSAASAAIHVNGAGARIRHISAINNTMNQVWGTSGVITMNGVDGRLEYVRVSGNSIGDGVGAGMIMFGSDATGTNIIANVHVTSNLASSANWTGSLGSGIGCNGANMPGVMRIVFGALVTTNQGAHAVMALTGAQIYTSNRQVVANSTLADNPGAICVKDYSYVNFRNCIVADNKPTQIIDATTNGLYQTDWTLSQWDHCLVAGEVSSQTHPVLLGQSSMGTFFTNDGFNGYFDLGGSVQANGGGAGFVDQAGRNYALSTNSAGYGAGIARYDSRGFAYVEINGVSGYQAGSDVIVDLKDNCSYLPGAADFCYPTDINGNEWIVRRSYSSNEDLQGKMNMGALSRKMPAPAGTVIRLQ